MRRLFLIAVMFLLFIPLTIMAQQEDETGADTDPYTVYTYHRADGNRFADGEGTFPDVQQVEIRDDNNLRTWLLGSIVDGELTWTFALGGAPLFPEFYGYDDAELRDEIDPITATERAVFAAVTPYEDSLYYVGGTGNLIRYRDGEIVGMGAITAVYDARPVFSADGRIAILTEPSDRYPHGVMGDTIEALEISVLSIGTDDLTVDARFHIDDLAIGAGNRPVFETLFPMWADVDGDGLQDIVVTRSAAGEGAQIIVVRPEDGSAFGSESIGLSNRWRHPIAFGAFGPDGQNELVEVVTPHIGGIVQFLRYNPETDALDVVASTTGYASHLYGSPNLDQAITGDFNGDGQPELVIVTQQRTAIVGLQHVSEGVVEEVWSIPLIVPPTTNFAAITLPDGGLVLGLGFADRTNIAYLPE